MKKLICFIFALSMLSAHAQKEDPYKLYLDEQSQLGNNFSEKFYSKIEKHYSLEPEDFTRLIDSLKKPFKNLVAAYANTLDESFIEMQHNDIHFFFGKLLLDYPYYHKLYTGQKAELPMRAQKELTENISKIDNPKLIKVDGYNDYVMAFLHHRANDKIEAGEYDHSCNQQLDAVLDLLPQYFTNKECLDYWMFVYLKRHIENYGIKAVDSVVNDYITHGTNELFINQISRLYADALDLRQGHRIETYKTINGIELDMHLFMPDSSAFPSKTKPSIVYFHGGSWTEGKPAWFFHAAQEYAENGRVAAAVEYRLADRHGTLPFEAVKDAKSAIRWLRANAEELGIAKDSIVATGNSAGGHLVLCSALNKSLNEESDNLNISPAPDVLLVNAGVYDLTESEWITANFENKDTVKAISPSYLIRKITQPVLLIHGTLDKNVPYETAQRFYQKAQEEMPNLEFKTLHGAGHFIWFDEEFSGKVRQFRMNFLLEHGFKL